MEQVELVAVEQEILDQIVVHLLLVQELMAELILAVEVEGHIVDQL